MKISAALSNVNRLGIDSAPFIYLVERRVNYTERMNVIFRYIRDGKIVGVSSVITLTEVLTKPIQRGDHTLANAYQNMLLKSRHFQLVSITASVAERAAELRAHYNLKTPDALQISSAVDAGCDAFITNDFGLKRIQEIQVLLLDELDLDS